MNPPDAGLAPEKRRSTLWQKGGQFFARRANSPAQNTGGEKLNAAHLPASPTSSTDSPVPFLILPGERKGTFLDSSKPDLLFRLNRYLQQQQQLQLENRQPAPPGNGRLAPEASGFSTASERSVSPVSTLRPPASRPATPSSMAYIYPTTPGSTVRQTPIVGRKLKLPDFPVRLQCPHCYAVVTSEVEARNGSMVWLASFGLLVFTVVLAWVPFVVDAFKDVVHSCPKCHERIARIHRL
ncbi:uncharacterized protein VTP21DRAFT_6960 [Calcarisporiella thermophila]|uniref:uncharacterized protein n=1 Tax=Calcarisporiella thermophila TaxID=911321 RepID=UPI0037436E52